MNSVFSFFVLVGFLNNSLSFLIDMYPILHEIGIRRRDIAEKIAKSLEDSPNVPFLIRKEGYPVESHTVVTEDGYLLTLHRIPGPGEPVLLHHGLMGTSGDWIYLGKGNSIGYMFADLGYDVWLGNSRGNTYSRGHVSMSTDILNDKYWDFSWHEIGVYDLPAVITYITNLTEKPVEIFMGHSMGVTSYFVMASERPEFQEKVRMMAGLGPIAFISNISPLMKLMAIFIEQFRLSSLNYGIHQVPPYDIPIRYIMRILFDLSVFSKQLHNLLLVTILDSNDPFDNPVMRTLLTNDPSSTSMKTLAHYAQEIISGHFRKYDYGPEWNTILYNSTEPPDYNISRITTPTILVYSDNDARAVTTDVEKLRGMLPNVVDSYRLKNASHVDFLFGMHTPAMIFKRISYILRRKKRPSSRN